MVLEVLSREVDWDGHDTMTDDRHEPTENGSPQQPEPKQRPACEICDALSRFKDKERRRTVAPCRRTCSLNIDRDSIQENMDVKSNAQAETALTLNSLAKITEDCILKSPHFGGDAGIVQPPANQSDRKRVKSPRAANFRRKRASSWSTPVVCDCGKRWSSDGRLLRTESEMGIDIEDMSKPNEDSHDEKLVAELTQAVPKINLSLQDEAETGIEDANVCKLCRSPNCLSVRPTVGFYTEEQIKLHTRPNDCWITAHGNVYDVTRYIGKHPGGSRSILNYGGRDTSRHYDFHMPFTRKKLWVRYKIGKVAYCDAKERGENCTIS